MKNRIGHYLTGLWEEAKLREIPGKTAEYLKASLVALLIIAGVIAFYGSFVWMWGIITGETDPFSWWFIVHVVVFTTLLIVGAFETVLKREPASFAVMLWVNVFILLLERFLDGKSRSYGLEMFLVIAAALTAGLVALLTYLVVGKYFRDHP